MPRQAVALKKYRRGTSPVSKISDNEDPTPSLGYSKVLSVKNSVGDPIPAFPQESEKHSKRPPSITRQHAGDVLPYQPSTPQPASKSSELNRELATLSIHSRSETGDTEILARCSSDQNVDCSKFITSDLREISYIRNIWIVMRQHRRRKFLDLRHRSALPRRPSD
jgi:hypothetical protein